MPPSLDRTTPLAAAEHPAAPPPGPVQWAAHGRGDVACAHCGLPVPPVRIETGAELHFCCSGCQTVHGVLRAHSLTRYYDHRAASAAGSQATRSTGRDYAEFDDPKFLELYAEQRGASCELELLLEGVHCAACVWLIEKLPLVVEGVTSCRLDFAERVAAVTWDPARTHASALARGLDRLGYPPHPRTDWRASELARHEDRELLLRLGVAGACAGNAMLLALALYSGVGGMEAGFRSYFRWASLVVSLPAVLWSAQVFYRGARAALSTRTPHMDVPITLALLIGAVQGVINTLRGEGDIYFDTLTGLIFLLLVGRYLQQRAQRKAERSAGAAQALTPRTARLLEGGQPREVPAASVAVGARVEVRAGDVFPVDGRVEEGISTVDLAWLTGESYPQALRPGASVFAGALNLSGRLVVVAERSGEETRTSRLWQEVRRASQRRAPIQLLADRLSAHFLWAVLALAALAFVLALDQGVWGAAERASALLIITCPCALGLATPLAISAALGQAARAGWLIKGGAVLQALAKPATLVFDKTGTLTLGRFDLVRWVGDHELMACVKALEQCSAHPIAQALVRALADVPGAVVSGCEEQPGCGVSGIHEGERVFVGSPRALAGSPQSWAASALEEIVAAGLTPVVVCVAGALRAVLGLGDAVRPDAAASLSALKSISQRLVLLSGDNAEVVQHVAGELCRRSGEPALFAEVHGGMSPERKLAWVEEQRRHGSVFMVGDGVNDAAALAAATVGVAVQGGAEASLEAADVLALQPGVAPLVHLLEGARRARGVVLTNLGLSLVYNTCAAALALAGAVSPLLAAVLMPISSLSVVLLSYKRRSFRA